MSYFFFQIKYCNMLLIKQSVSPWPMYITFRLYVLKSSKTQSLWYLAIKFHFLALLFDHAVLKKAIYIFCSAILPVRASGACSFSFLCLENISNFCLIKGCVHAFWSVDKIELIDLISNTLRYSSDDQGSC